MTQHEQQETASDAKRCTDAAATKHSDIVEKELKKAARDCAEAEAFAAMAESEANLAKAEAKDAAYHRKRTEQIQKQIDDEERRQLAELERRRNQLLAIKRTLASCAAEASNDSAPLPAELHSHAHQ